jgi:hypothetical protein
VRRVVALSLVLLALLAGSAVGKVSTASNTVPAGTVGQGSTATSTYTVSAVHYTLDTNSPQSINQVAFTISPPNPRILKVQLVSGGSWYSCVNTSGAVTCATTSPQANVSTAHNLTVVASQ